MSSGEYILSMQEKTFLLRGGSLQKDGLKMLILKMFKLKMLILKMFILNLLKLKMFKLKIYVYEC
jgi:hypothetical protein